MKFSGSKFWKHRNICCEFIEILEIIFDDGETAEIKASLNEQLNSGYKTLIPSYQFIIGRKEYPKWRAYVPRTKGR